MPALGLVMVVGIGLTTGLWDGRWGKHQPTDYAALMPELPEIVNAWVGQAVALDRSTFTIGGIVEGRGMRYVNRQAGAEAVVSLLAGEPAGIAAHTPEVCLPNQGFVPLSAPTETLMRQPGNQELLAGMYSAAFVLPQREEQWYLCWAWFDQHKWQVADSPRFAFGHLPGLVKIYVAFPDTLPVTPTQREEQHAFVAALLTAMTPGQTPAHSH